MDSIVVEGGARLSGKIAISGAKNAALPLLAAALLPAGASTYKNVPAARPTCARWASCSRILGWTVDDAPRAVTIAPPTGKKKPKLEAPYDLVKTMRASVLVLGPLVARYGRARVSMPGGCAIGARPIDQHLKGLAAMGAQDHARSRLRRRRGQAPARRDDRARHADRDGLREHHDGGGARARAARSSRTPRASPRSRSSRSCSTRWARKIQGAGTAIITIEGVDELQPIEHAIIPDRIEAGTFAVAAAITRGDVAARRRARRAHGRDHREAARRGRQVAAEAGGMRVRGTGRDSSRSTSSRSRTPASRPTCRRSSW